MPLSIIDERENRLESTDSTQFIQLVGRDPVDWSPLFLDSSLSILSSDIDGVGLNLSFPLSLYSIIYNRIFLYSPWTSMSSIK